jgi:hypothetical protein
MLCLIGGNSDDKLLMFQADVYVQRLSHAVAAFLEICHKYNRLMLSIVKFLEVIPRAVSWYHFQYITFETTAWIKAHPLLGALRNYDLIRLPQILATVPPHVRRLQANS